MNSLRCFCSRRPLLAVYGTDDRGKPFVHVKAHKQGRLITEVIFTEGTLRIHCRECLRWYTIRIREQAPDRVNVREEPLPAQISV